MKELSLNILDIAENSVKAGADTVRITLTETDNLLTIRIEDNGCGMKKDFLERGNDESGITFLRMWRLGLWFPQSRI